MPSTTTTVAAAAAAFTAGAAAAYAAPSLLRATPPRLIPRLAGISRTDHVALTFDDGPDRRSTPAVLRALDQLGWRATFFCLGTMAEAAPGLLREMVSAGHEIGVHGYVHEGAIRRRPRALVDDVVRARGILGDATGLEPHWYRPPFGELSLGTWTVTRATGLRLILWSAWGRDWRAEATPVSVVQDVVGGVVRGGTVLLHDSDCTSSPSSWRTTVAALPLLADELRGRHLAVGPLADHGLAA